MGIEEGEVEEEGGAAVSLGEEGDGFAGTPEGVGELLVQVKWAADEAIGRGAVGHAPTLAGREAAELREPVDVIVVVPTGRVGQLQMVKPEAFPGGREVELADHLGLVAGLAQLASEGVRWTIGRVVVGQDAVRRG